MRTNKNLNEAIRQVLKSFPEGATVTQIQEKLPDIERHKIISRLHKCIDCKFDKLTRIWRYERYKPTEIPKVRDRIIVALQMFTDKATVTQIQEKLPDLDKCVISSQLNGGKMFVRTGDFWSLVDSP